MSRFLQLLTFSTQTKALPCLCVMNAQICVEYALRSLLLGRGTGEKWKDATAWANNFSAQKWASSFSDSPFYCKKSTPWPSRNEHVDLRGICCQILNFGAGGQGRDGNVRLHELTFFSAQKRDGSFSYSPFWFKQKHCPFSAYWTRWFAWFIWVSVWGKWLKTGGRRTAGDDVRIFE
jgi:hypothetical protein